ncbi:MAG: murein biosynthesis integral membrane protein MurJ [Candidatus Nealsonbacteria bacterium CG10_big_fil_rev_8_21_14_0_10_36_24]|uniref:Probable lipid II flippase MurJ n=1 Tax=Candidatus Nealsonbacteria bacterium CG10_big_fil_rev_8_21_14_0_10_36_24 TaxID=1974710 RepID=A0A2M6NRI4_9BACT|nr:MAG: murein biosynthesis integral membrane protein MurJ [Candidatus Nealsonbacteria bacterium CG10_big_fil_rev_8_21_14_0_10_36_24]
MYNHIFNSQTRTITSAAGILAVSSLLSGLLGLFRDRLLAGSFGAGNELDIYYGAFRVPDFISMVLVMGAISAAIIPIFSSYLVRSRQEAWEFFANLLNLFLFFLIIISVILIIFVPQILSLIVPGFSDEKKELTITLTRIMFLSPIFLGISNTISGVLRVFRRFLVTSIAPIMYNLGIIFGILFFVPWLGLNGLAWGVVFGGFLHFFIQLPILLKTGFKPKIILNFSHPGFIKTIKLTLPRALGLAAGQINLIVITAIGSTLAAGSIAVFNLANNLQNLPITLIAISFSTAAFPFLALYFSKKDKEKLLEEFSSVFRQILFLIVPVSILIFILRAQIIRVILGTGKFGWADTQLTAACLGIFSFAIFAYGLVLLISKTFYAFQNTKIPALVTLFTVGLNIVLCYFFVRVLGFENTFQSFLINFLDLQGIKDNSVIGLPLALAVSGIFQISLLLFLLYKKIGDFRIKEIFESCIKILASGVLLGFACYFVRQTIAEFVDMQTFWGIFCQAALASIVGIIVFIASAFALKSPEIKALKTLIYRKNGR